MTVPDENIFEKAFREQREVWAELDALRAENERLREALERWEAVVNSVTSGHNKLGLNGYDIVEVELRILRYGREQDADEIERLRGLIARMVEAYHLRMDGAISADDYLTVLDLLREEARRD